jgi:ribonuclease J
LVIDIYTAWVLEQIKLVTPNVPAMEWDGVKVYATHSHDERVTQHPEAFGDFRRRLYKHRVKPEEIQANPADYLFYGKTSSFWMIDIYKSTKPVNVIYSQWLGYLASHNTSYYGAQEVAAYRNDPQVNFVYAHTSGHATVEDLQTFAATLKPKILAPVHTEAHLCFPKLFNNVLLSQHIEL